MKIDKDGDLKMMRATYNKGGIEIKTTDHYTFVLKFKDMKLKQDDKVEKSVIWNTNKPGGWIKYKELSNK